MRGKDFLVKEKRFLKKEEKFLLKEEQLLKKEISFLLHYKFFFKFHYPKLALFVVCIFAAYLFFSDQFLVNLFGRLGELSYLGTFVAGILFSFGFTAPFSAGLLLVIQPENIFLATAIGALGCAFGNILIFKFVRFSFTKEINRLKKERPFHFIRYELSKKVNPKVWHYLLFVFSFSFFMTPFIPDEAAVTILASTSSMNSKKIAVISFVCSSIGIFFFLAL